MCFFQCYPNHDFHFHWMFDAAVVVVVVVVAAAAATLHMQKSV